MQFFYPFSADTVSGSRVANLANGSAVFDATLHNGAVVSNGQLQLNSNMSQYLSLPPFNSSLGGMTFACWFKSINSGKWARILDFGNGAPSDNFLWTVHYGARNVYGAQFYTHSTVSVSLRSTLKVNNNNWFHGAWTLDRDGIYSLYLNGSLVLQMSSALYPRPIERSLNYLGRSPWTIDSYFNGSIKDFRMYNYTLSSAEIRMLSFVPTVFPTSQPSQYPSISPTGTPTVQPSSQPVLNPVSAPSFVPSRQPSISPYSLPTEQPTRQPKRNPSQFPSVRPSSQPFLSPSFQPFNRPTEKPYRRPSEQPSFQPFKSPTVRPTRAPSSFPSLQPSLHPNEQPSCWPSMQPTRHPNLNPSGQPTKQPLL